MNGGFPAEENHRESKSVFAALPNRFLRLPSFERGWWRRQSPQSADRSRAIYCCYCVGASEATIFSKRGSPRNGSQNGSNFNSP